MAPPPERLLDQAAGALWGLAIGDALGMPTQLLSRKEVVGRYGEITWFEAPAQDHPIAAGLPAGRTTDDTAQALLLAELLEGGGQLDQRRWAAALLDWEQSMRAAGSPDLLGPSTSAALHGLRRGASYDDAGRTGTTNGAAMRICPVGIAVPSTPLDVLVDRVVEASRLTHATSMALSAAAAVAAAVSSALDGCTLTEARAVAMDAAVQAADRGVAVPGPTVADRIAKAVETVAGLPSAAVPAAIANRVGTGLASTESVPAAFAVVAAFSGDPWRVVCTAAALGGDSDTIAAMAGAMSGAVHGASTFPPAAVALVASVNGLDVSAVARHLLDLRCP